MDIGVATIVDKPSSQVTAIHDNYRRLSRDHTIRRALIGLLDLSGPQETIGLDRNNLFLGLTREPLDSRGSLEPKGS